MRLLGLRVRAQCTRRLSPRSDDPPRLASPHLSLLLSLTRSFISCMAVRSSESVCDTPLTRHPCAPPRLWTLSLSNAWSEPLGARIGLGLSNLTVFGGKLGWDGPQPPAHAWPAAAGSCSASCVVPTGPGARPTPRRAGARRGAHIRTQLFGFCTQKHN